MEQERGIQEVKKGFWSPEEDEKLRNYISTHGKGNWNEIPNLTGLQRLDNSCRRRWCNYLDPDRIQADFTDAEKLLIIRLHNTLGNKWAKIAKSLHGRTDNDIKNLWKTAAMKKFVATHSNQSGTDHLLRNPNEINMPNPTPTMAPVESAFDELELYASLSPLPMPPQCNVAPGYPPVWRGGFIPDSLGNAINTDPRLLDPSSSSLQMDNEMPDFSNFVDNGYALPSTSSTPPPPASYDPFAMPTN